MRRQGCITTGTGYTVKDKHNRTWGWFEVIGERYGKIYGYLNPEREFEEVKIIFLEHQKAFNDPSVDTQSTISKILELGAYLIDNASGEKIDIRGNIFIGNNLLVTCEIPDL